MNAKLIAVGGLYLVLNLIWKIRLMNDERSLLEQGKAVS